MKLLQSINSQIKQYSFLFLVILSACTNQENSIDKNNRSVQLSTEQLKKIRIEIGKIDIKVFPKSIDCSGYIDVPPTHKASVTAPMSGFVKTILYYPGSFVNKGAVLAVFEHSNYIKLQEEYLEAKNKLSYHKAEFSRQGELTIENATSIKTFQKAQVDYRTTEVKYLSLKAQISFLGLNPDSLTEDGIQPYINIYAPISGYITKIDANIGKFIDSQKFIYEIADISSLFLFLKIKESDIFYLEPEQKITFHTNSTNKKYSASIKFIEQTLDKENKSIAIHAKIDSTDNFLKPGMFVRCNLLYDKDSVFAISEKAIIKENNSSFIIIKENNRFTRISIQAGVSHNGFVEFINPTEYLTNSIIVINGVNKINSQINKTN